MTMNEWSTLICNLIKLEKNWKFKCNVRALLKKLNLHRLYNLCHREPEIKLKIYGNAISTPKVQKILFSRMPDVADYIA